MINESVLRDELLSYLKSISSDKQIVSALLERLAKERSLSPGKVSGVIGGMDGIEVFSPEEMFWIASAALPSFEPSKYYSDKESKVYTVSKIQTQKSLFPIEFENCLQISNEQYLTTITTKRLMEFSEAQVLSYNLYIQRNPRIEIVDDKEQLRIRINKRSVNEIKSLILRGKFIPNALTFNVRQSVQLEWDYDFDSATFTLSNGGFDIIDGYHRYLAILQAMRQKPELELTFPLYITAFEEEVAKRFIAQEDKRNKIDPGYSRTLDSTRFENRVVMAMNEDPDFYLYDQIKPFGKRKLDSGKMIICVGSLFKQHFSRESTSDIINLKRYLVSNLNAVFDKDMTLLNTLTDTDIRVALCVLDVCYDDPDVVDKVIKYIYYYRDKAQEGFVRHTPALKGEIQKREELSHVF